MSHPMQGLPSPAAHSLLQDDPMHPALILTFPVTPANVLHSVKSLMAARRKTDSKRFGKGFVSNQFSGKKNISNKSALVLSHRNVAVLVEFMQVKPMLTVVQQRLKILRRNKLLQAVLPLALTFTPQQRTKRLLTGSIIGLRN